MDQGSNGSAAQGQSGAMNIRLIAIMATIGAIVVGVIGYAIGFGNQETWLTAEQRNEIKTMVSQALESASAEASPETEIAALGEDRRGVIEVLIRTHLLANPEIITDAIDELRAREGQDELAEVGDAIVTNAEMIFDSDRQVVMGNPDGDVTLVEFFDYNCPYCRRSSSDIQQLIEEDHGLRGGAERISGAGRGLGGSRAGRRRHQADGAG